MGRPQHLGPPFTCTVTQDSHFQGHSLCQGRLYVSTNTGGLGDLELCWDLARKPGSALRSSQPFPPACTHCQGPEA